MSATAFTVTAVDKLPLPAGDAFLAPDGSRIAWTDGNRVCLYSPSGKRQGCVASTNGIDPNSLRWSPDIQHIAFTEGGNLKEPDIWILDVNTQQLTNLTPDQATSITPGRFEGNWDLWPQWSSDSQRLLFVRYAGTDASKQDRPQLFTISADGGEPQLLKNIPCSYSVMEVMPAWSTVDDSIGYNIGYVGLSDQPDMGLWVVKANGQDAQHVLGVPEGNSGQMLEVNFSADGRYLLMPYDYLHVAGKLHEQRSLRIAAIDGGGELPVASDDAAYFAMWAPHGSGLAYIVRGDSSRTVTKQPSGLYVVDKPGDHGKLIYEGKLWSPFKHAFARMPIWATNHTMLVRSDDSYLLMHLTAE